VGYKPADFFVGVIDVFAVLLPGALLAFVTKDMALAYVFGTILPPVRGVAQGWIAFIFASYLLGHFIFLVGSFLDRTVYDPYRERFLTRDSDLVYERAKEIKVRHVEDTDEAEVVNTFKWAKIHAQILSPSGLVEINRLEADSKFFRSLIVVLFLIALILVYEAAFLAHGTALIGSAACLLLMVLSFLRYADQRFKSTQLAYAYLIALDTLNRPDENAEEA